MTDNEQAKKYYDALIASYDVMTDALNKASEQGIKVSSQIAQDIANGQREALELGKKLATETKDLGELYTALVEATTAAQGRALTFAQYTYQEAMESGTQGREYVEKLIEANKETSKAAVELARTWATANPLADMMRKGMEAMSPAAAEKGSKAKAS
jgi:hypothetical protein